MKHSKCKSIAELVPDNLVTFVPRGTPPRLQGNSHQGTSLIVDMLMKRKLELFEQYVDDHPEMCYLGADIDIHGVVNDINTLTFFAKLLSEHPQVSGVSMFAIVLGFNGVAATKLFEMYKFCSKFCKFRVSSDALYELVRNSTFELVMLRTVKEYTPDMELVRDLPSVNAENREGYIRRHYDILKQKSVMCRLFEDVLANCDVTHFLNDTRNFKDTIQLVKLVTGASIHPFEHEVCVQRLFERMNQQKPLREATKLSSFAGIAMDPNGQEPPPPPLRRQVINGKTTWLGEIITWVYTYRNTLLDMNDPSRQTRTIDDVYMLNRMARFLCKLGCSPRYYPVGQESVGIEIASKILQQKTGRSSDTVELSNQEKALAEFFLYYDHLVALMYGSLQPRSKCFNLPSDIIRRVSDFLITPTTLVDETERYSALKKKTIKIIHRCGPPCKLSPLPDLLPLGLVNLVMGITKNTT